MKSLFKTVIKGIRFKLQLSFINVFMVTYIFKTKKTSRFREVFVNYLIHSVRNTISKLRD